MLQNLKELFKAATYCDFKDNNDQIRDRFILGLADQDITQKLHLENDLTLSRAVEVAKQCEQIIRDMMESRSQQNSRKTSNLSKANKTTNNSQVRGVVDAEVIMGAEDVFWPVGKSTTTATM